MFLMYLKIMLGICYIVIGALCLLLLYADIAIWLDSRRYNRAVRFARDWYSRELGPEFSSDGENETEESET